MKNSNTLTRNIYIQIILVAVSTLLLMFIFTELTSAQEEAPPADDGGGGGGGAGGGGGGGDLSSQAQQGVDAVGGGGQGADIGSIIQNVVNTLSFVVGVLSVIMIIIGGLRYIISAGDSNAAQAARNTILYAIVGLVVALSAYIIVNFVIGLF